MKGKLTNILIEMFTTLHIRNNYIIYIIHRKEKERRRLEDNKDTKEIDKELKSIREHYLGTLCKFISYITILHMVYKRILSHTVHFFRL